MALKYRDKVAWTQRAFKAIGEDAAAAESGAELVKLTPDARPDTINATDTGLAMNDVPTEAIVGVSVALLLLLIIMLVFSLVVVTCIYTARYKLRATMFPTRTLAFIERL